jgi:serine/threonine-protein kinase
MADGHCNLSLVTKRSINNEYWNSQYNDYAMTVGDWEDAQAYCDWTGRRLPSESEWEKAARGTDGRIYPWGNKAPEKNLLNYNMSADNSTMVGSYPSGASPYGALDMAGNMWEWVYVLSSYTKNSQSPSRNPTEPGSELGHMLRGGSLASVDWLVRSAYRGGGSFRISLNEIGFRCAASP